MALKGQDILLMTNGTDMMGVVAHDIQAEADTIEIANATQGQWRDFISGKKSWVITANTLVLSAGMSIGLLQVGQTFAMRSYDRDSTYNNVHGQAELQQCRIDATKGALVKGYFKFLGTQDLWAQQVGTGGDFNNDFNADFKIQ
jgi:hypothetical protein